MLLPLLGTTLPPRLAHPGGPTAWTMAPRALHHKQPHEPTAHQTIAPSRRNGCLPQPFASHAGPPALLQAHPADHQFAPASSWPASGPPLVGGLSQRSKISQLGHNPAKGDLNHNSEPPTTYVVYLHGTYHYTLAIVITHYVLSC